jgi:L-arabinose isomerase
VEHAVASVSEEEITEEKERDRARFDFDEKNVIEQEYHASVKACLALRKCIAEKGFDAFSVNFLNIEKLGTMPFAECCRAMENGIGYAGEGDALTAAFVGAFLASTPETNFVEIFCPDWKNNTVFMSHMGEMNYRIADGKPLLSRTGSDYVKGTMPYAGYCRMKAGEGVYLNVSRDKDDYKLVIAPARMLPAEQDCFTHAMRGWMQPEGCANTAEFLEKLSENGATHHSVFVYGAKAQEIEFFGKLLSMKTVLI